MALGIARANIHLALAAVGVLVLGALYAGELFRAGPGRGGQV